jgi:NADPH:quinone reductase-like Zn-dependent oxidoreductase
MKAAIVETAGQAPVYGDFRDPVSTVGTRVVRVRAAAISHVTRSRASGAHYSATGTLPFIPGVDGAGVSDTGQRVYFLLPQAPFGAMAEWCKVDDAQCIALADGVDFAAAAAMAIPGMSSWAALTERAKLLPGETVLINGATGTSGRLAIQVARHLGARKIIATARDQRAFDELRHLGADVTIALTTDTDALVARLMQEFQSGVDVVLDYLWGMSAEALLVAGARAGQDGVPIRFVQIGSISADTINLPSAALRSSAIQLMGSGIGSIPLPTLLRAIKGVLDAAPSAGFTVSTTPVPLADVNRVWSDEATRSRVVLVP